MKNDFHADELREQFIQVVLAGEAGINAHDRGSDFLLLYNAEELLLIARRIHVIAAAYKKLVNKETREDDRNG